MSKYIEHRAWDSETKSREWLEHSPACTKVVDLDFNLQYMSNAGVMALKIDDVNELYGKPYPFDFYPESFRRQMIASLERAAAGEVVAQEAAVYDKDGAEMWFHSTLVPMKGDEGQVEYIMVVSINTTERRSAEEALRRMQQLESIGSLAGGIAHDFNNLLMGLFGNLSLAKLELEEDHPAFPFLEDAEASLARATRLSNQLLTFATGGKPIKEETSIGDLIEEVAAFDLSGSNVGFVLDVAEDPWIVEADKGQLQQAISNLVINADQAMPDGGHLLIKLENTELRADELPSLRAGKYVKITVRDEGTGISPEHLERVFDPYFTTKPTGRGLGLSTTYSVITKHGGRIDAESEPGRGTSFVMHLPASASLKSSPPHKAATERPQGETRATVLLMDDDAAILDVVSTMLRRTGYEAEGATGSEHAVELYRRSAEAGRPFDAVILDLTIPGGPGGKETVREILKIDPEAVVIASSGYTADPAMADCSAFGFKGVITKPYTPEELRTVLTRVLRK